MKIGKMEKIMEVLKEIQYENKSLTQVALERKIDPGNLSRDVREFKEMYPKVAKIVDSIRASGLILRTEWGAKLKKRRSQMADSGLYPGRAHLFGAILKDGLFLPKPEENKELLELLKYYSEGKGPTWLSKKFKIPKTTIQRIVRDIRYDNRFIFGGKEYVGSWPRLVPKELWDKVQSRHSPKSGTRYFGYEWWNGKPREIHEEATICNRVVQKYLKGKSQPKIASEEGISKSLVYKTLTDERRTGWILKDGELVSSGYPAIINRHDFETVQKILKSRERWESFKKEREEKAKRIRAKILSLVPDYRLSIRKKIPERTRGQIYHVIRQMKDQKVLYDREDGLLQFYGLPFPDVPLHAPILKQAMIEHLKDGKWRTRKQIFNEIGMNRHTINSYIRILKALGKVEERDHQLRLKVANPDFS
jgi:transposase